MILTEYDKDELWAVMDEVKGARSTLQDKQDYLRRCVFEYCMVKGVPVGDVANATELTTDEVNTIIYEMSKSLAGLVAVGWHKEDVVKFSKISIGQLNRIVANFERIEGDNG